MAERSLSPCPPERICVCSLASDARHRIQPLKYGRDAQMAWRIALQAVKGMPRTRLVDSADGYLRAECVSAVLHRPADLELLIDLRQSVIHVRSASRKGWWDLGSNRRRVEALRKEFDVQIAKLEKPPAAPGGSAAPGASAGPSASGGPRNR
jgi:uncharacterized protein (DUF1499 family)